MINSYAGDGFLYLDTYRYLYYFISFQLCFYAYFKGSTYTLPLNFVTLTDIVSSLETFSYTMLVKLFQN